MKNIFQIGIVTRLNMLFQEVKIEYQYAKDGIPINFLRLKAKK